MKRIMVRSVYDAFEFVMQHYYPAGLKEYAEREDSYAVISIQDTHSGGFGFEFRENEFCKGVLTLYFDDIEAPVEGAVLFSEKQAEDILSFALAQKDADTLLVHCYGGESRSRAVGAFLVKYFGGDDSEYFRTGHPNMHVYRKLEEVSQKR